MGRATTRLRSMRAVGIMGMAVVATGGLIVSSAPGAVAGRPPLVGPLVASGTMLLDQGAGGAPVTLQGVNMEVLTDQTDNGGFVDSKAMITLQSWGANFVRLNISSDQYLQQCPGDGYDPEYPTQLAQTVQALTAKHMFVLLDVYASDPNCLWQDSQTSGAVPLPGEEVGQALGELVSQFGWNPLVGYEPFNEPEACALSTTGPGASQFVPADSEPGGVCPTEAQSELAWNDPGTVVVGGTSAMGTIVGGRRYEAPGMAQLYETIMANVPPGAPPPLVFMDANGWAADPSTFDAMSQPLAGATNVVEVFHPYDCQDTSSYPEGFQSATCRHPAPEACATATANVGQYLVDPATQRGWSRPVVFDEFNFPSGEAHYYYQESPGLLSARVPVAMYQGGAWVNNTIAAIQGGGAAGWAVYYFQNADMNDVQSPYSIVAGGVDASTPAPWEPNVNDAPAVSAMGGARLSCEEPPPGFG
jgi:hypothetical protein